MVGSDKTTSCPAKYASCTCHSFCCQLADFLFAVTVAARITESFISLFCQTLVGIQLLVNLKKPRIFFFYMEKVSQAEVDQQMVLLYFVLCDALLCHWTKRGDQSIQMNYFNDVELICTKGTFQCVLQFQYFSAMWVFLHLNQSSSLRRQQQRKTRHSKA